MSSVPVELIQDIDFLGSVYQDVENKFRDCTYRQPFADFVPVLERAHSIFFAAEQSPTGIPWAPLARSTVRRKKHSRILVDTGRLLGSLSSSDHTDAIRDIEDRYLAFGTSVPYAIYHQTGTSRMPARPPVGLNEVILNLLCNRLADHVVEALKVKV